MSDNPKPRRLPKDLPLTRLLPNMLTLLSLCSGLTAMRYALQENWEYAFLGIVIAAIFDMLDGRVARLLNIASKFGAELDSLSDAISFGVAPGFVIYLWTLQGNRIGWIAVLGFAVCAALRLARFNTMLEDTKAPAWSKSFFTGMPTPAGAGMALLPLASVLEFGPDAHIPATYIALWLLVIGGLMISRVPTFALKGWRITPKWVAPILVLAVLLIAALITNTWLTLFSVGMAYLLSLPFAVFVYRRRALKEGI